MTERSRARGQRAARTRERLIGSAAQIFCRAGSAVPSLCVISARAEGGGGAPHFCFAGQAALTDAVQSAAPDRLRITAAVTVRQGAAGSRA